MRVPTTVIAASTDQLVPLAQLESLVDRLGAPATLVVVDTPYGHDAFLKETQAIADLLREVLP